eukprot:m.1514988 g.1514988  ORF g.1514988 m.1514988 type:complete len:908 (+) comp25215_c0_seq18:340-3063(+)
MGTRRLQPQALRHSSVLHDFLGMLSSATSRTDTPASTAARSAEPPLWIKFDKSGTSPPLQLLTIGFSHGFSIWDMTDTDNIHEMLSVRDTCVTAATLLPEPLQRHTRQYNDDAFASHRPLVAVICESKGAGSSHGHDEHGDATTQSRSIRLMSLRTGRTVSWKGLSSDGSAMECEPVDILANTQMVAVVCASGRLLVLDPATLELRHVINDCAAVYTDPYARDSAPGSVAPRTFSNTVAIGPSWLAYAAALPGGSFSSGGRHGNGGPDAVLDVLGDADGGTSVATLVGMAQKTGSDLWDLGGRGVHTVSGLLRPARDMEAAALGSSPPRGLANPLTRTPGPGSSPPAVSAGCPACAHTHSHAPRLRSHSQDGTVVVVDATRRVLTRFRATRHRRPLATLRFDTSGLLLATTCTQGQVIDIFHLAHPRGKSPEQKFADTGPSPVTPQHLYTLERGVTTTLMRDIVFSPDSMWVSAISDHGTAHVFGINPSGGEISCRTHARETLSTRFQTTSGQDANAIDTKATTVVHGALIMIKHLHTDALTTNTAPGSGAHILGLGAAPAAAQDGTEPPLRVQHNSACMGLLFGDSFVCSDVETSTHEKLVCVPITVVTPEGAIVEHRLYPYAVANHASAFTQIQRLVREDFGTLVASGESGSEGASGAMQRGLKTTMKTVGGAVLHAVAKATASTAHSAPETTRTGAGSPSLSSSLRSQGAITPPVTNDKLAVACAAIQWCDARRDGSWTPTANLSDPVTAPDPMDEEDMTPAMLEAMTSSMALASARPAVVMATQPPPDATAPRLRPTTDDEHLNRWLAHVELRTYPAPHRRLWMGPQFAFHPSTDLRSMDCNGHVLDHGTVSNRPLAFKTAGLGTRVGHTDATTDGTDSDNDTGGSTHSATDIAADIAEALQP